MERMPRIDRSGRSLTQGMSQQYQDMRINPMGNGAYGSHSVRNTSDDGQENPNGTSRKRIALAVSLDLSSVLLFLIRDCSALVVVGGK